MKGFSNENIIDKLCGGCDCTGFVAKLDYDHDPVAKTITFTDASTYPAGDGRKIVHITVRDKNAKKIVSNIPAADVDGIISVDVSTLDVSGGLSVEATVVTNKGCISDGRVDGIGINTDAGSLGYWDKDNNAIF